MNIEIGKLYLVIPKSQEYYTDFFRINLRLRKPFAVSQIIEFLDTGGKMVELVDLNKVCWVNPNYYDFVETKGAMETSKDTVMQDGLDCVVALDRCAIDKFEQVMLIYGRDIVNQREFLSVETIGAATELIKEIDALDDCTDPTERKLRFISAQLLEVVFRNLMAVDLDRLKVQEELRMSVK